MTVDEFRALLKSETDDAMLGPCLRDADTPYVFAPQPASWQQFRTGLAVALEIDPADLAVVGSGRLGFSLRPGNNFRPFRDQSDVDVVIVNSILFDRLWYALLDGLYPRPPATDKLGKWFKTRRSEVYTGFLTPDEVQIDQKIFGARVKPILDFRLHWWQTFKQAARHVPLRHEDVTSRLYRTWEHAELYHAHSLRALRRTL